MASLILITEKLKLDYLKNEKSFRIKTKTFFLVSQVPSSRRTRQSSKNIADTTFQARECYTNKDILKAKTRKFYI